MPGRWEQIDAFGRGRVDTDRLIRRSPPPDVA